MRLILVLVLLWQVCRYAVNRVLVLILIRLLLMSSVCRMISSLMSRLINLGICHGIVARILIILLVCVFNVRKLLITIPLLLRVGRMRSLLLVILSRLLLLLCLLLNVGVRLFVSVRLNRLILLKFDLMNLVGLNMLTSLTLRRFAGARVTWRLLLCLLFYGRLIVCMVPMMKSRNARLMHVIVLTRRLVRTLIRRRCFTRLKRSLRPVPLT